METTAHSSVKSVFQTANGITRYMQQQVLVSMHCAHSTRGVSSSGGNLGLWFLIWVYEFFSNQAHTGAQILSSCIACFQWHCESIILLTSYMYINIYFFSILGTVKAVFYLIY